MKDKDITQEVQVGDVDGELLALEQCVCGERFGLWGKTIGIYRDYASKCPACGRNLYFRMKLTIYEVVE